MSAKECDPCECLKFKTLQYVKNDWISTFELELEST